MHSERLYPPIPVAVNEEVLICETQSRAPGRRRPPPPFAAHDLDVSVGDGQETATAEADWLPAPRSSEQDEVTQSSSSHDRGELPEAEPADFLVAHPPPVRSPRS